MESDIKIEETIEPTINLLADNNINYEDYPNLTKEFMNYIALVAESYIRENALRYLPLHSECALALKQSFQIMNNILFAHMDNECKYQVGILDSNLRKIGMQIDYSQMERGNINIVKARQYCEYDLIPLGLPR